MREIDLKCEIDKRSRLYNGYQARFEGLEYHEGFDEVCVKHISYWGINFCPVDIWYSWSLCLDDSQFKLRY